jgi:hypothetical protein
VKLKQHSQQLQNRIAVWGFGGGEEAPDPVPGGKEWLAAAVSNIFHGLASIILHLEERKKEASNISN